MDRGAWQATVQGGARVGHDLATQPLLPLLELDGQKWVKAIKGTNYQL